MAERGSGTDTPSDDALVAASQEVPVNGVGDDDVYAAVRAAYAVDLPRVRAEERAATLDEVIEALEHWQSEAAIKDRSIPDAEWASAALYVKRKFKLGVEHE